MAVGPIISKTDLARRTRQVVDLARRGHPIIVESFGEEQVAILDAADYRLLRAAAGYYALPQHQAPINDPTLTPRGLTPQDVELAIADADGEPQAGWNRVLRAYWDGDISLGRAAQLLGIPRFDLHDRLNRLGLPLRSAPADVEEASAELSFLS